MSLLSICQNASNNVGVNVPAAIIGSTDPAAVRLLQLARTEARNLANRVNWVSLVVENVFIANGTSQYTLPADFRSMVGDTLWDRTRFWRMRGAMSPQQWQMYKSSIIGRATIERRWRIRIPSGDPAGATVDFEIDPEIGPTDTSSKFVYEYVSKNWCRSTTLLEATNKAIVNLGTGYVVGDTITLAGGTSTVATVLTVLELVANSNGQIQTVEITTPGNYTAAPSNPVSQASSSGAGIGATFTMTYSGLTQPDWAADTDTAIIDENLIELGVIWRLMRRLGLAYDEEKEEYERQVDLAVARDGGTAILSLAPRDPFTLISPYQIPDGNYPGIAT